MSSIRYALLSLLAREPLSGYDIKQQMNNRLGPFWKVGSNQVYPELAKMEGEGLVRPQGWKPMLTVPPANCTKLRKPERKL
ncbi:PadR family transcriptional regulator [Paenibacillus sp. P26]|nr:PadR family transcriptional regulator [Paenibacillus sp. P26]